MIVSSVCVCLRLEDGAVYRSACLLRLCGVGRVGRVVAGVDMIRRLLCCGM